MAKFFVLTDLEDVAGIDSVEHTRTSDDEQKAPAMDQVDERTIRETGADPLDPDDSLHGIL